MHVVYSFHAQRRLHQRGIAEFEVEDVLRAPLQLQKREDGRALAFGMSNNRYLCIVFVREENYIKVLTVM